jgi:hypothetical protein
VAEQSGDARESDTFTRLDTRHLFDANTVWLGLSAGSCSAITSGALSNCATPDCRWMKLNVRRWSRKKRPLIIRFKDYRGGG